MQNVLVDERENIYVIDFSETRPRNIVSDFARFEPHPQVRAGADRQRDGRAADAGIRAGPDVGPRSIRLRPTSIPGRTPPSTRHTIVKLLRWLADTATLFETDMVPYWLALLEWTLPVVVFRQSSLQKRYAAYSAGLLCEAILRAEPA